MASDQTEAITCTVCGEAAAVASSAICNWCDGRYHLNQRNDVESKDCGAVWIDEQFLALQFACNTCLEGQRAPAPPPAPTQIRPRGEAGTKRRYRKRE